VQSLEVSYGALAQPDGVADAAAAAAAKALAKTAATALAFAAGHGLYWLVTQGD
jgi:hypothetical protein